MPDAFALWSLADIGDMGSVMVQPVIEPFTAMQYLTWAIEEIDKFGNPLASRYAHSALAELKRAQREAQERLIIIKENQWPHRGGDADHEPPVRKPSAGSPRTLQNGATKRNVHSLRVILSPDPE